MAAIWDVMASSPHQGSLCLPGIYEQSRKKVGRGKKNIHRQNEWKKVPKSNLQEEVLFDFLFYCCFFGTFFGIFLVFFALATLFFAHPELH